jgi:hypothetical protein
MTRLHDLTAQLGKLKQDLATECDTPRRLAADGTLSTVATEAIRLAEGAMTLTWELAMAHGRGRALGQQAAQPVLAALAHDRKYLEQLQARLATLTTAGESSDG